MNKYLLKMFEEFKSAYGITNTTGVFQKYDSEFLQWVESKRKAAISYVGLFDYMQPDDEIETETIAEFGKGIYDTVAIAMAQTTSHMPIVISPYANTFKTDSGIEVFSGNLDILYGEVMVKYENESDYFENPNCHPYFNDEIGTLMTQIPSTNDELAPFIELLNSNKTLFIGTYGSLNDKDKISNLKKISNLCDIIKDVSSRDVDFCSETKDDSYISAIKISSKVKKLENTLTFRR